MPPSPAAPSTPNSSPICPPRSTPAANAESSTPSPSPAQSSRVPFPYFPARSSSATILSMPIFSPPLSPSRKQETRPKRHAQSQLRWMRVCLLLLVASAASAQVLARPGLAGSGLKNSPWWQHAVFYQVDRSPDSLDLKAVPARLDALRSLGVDALLLPAPELPAPGTNAAMPSFDDLDNLLRQASAHRIRVLLTIHASSPTADLSGVARFWLTRGVAGLHIAAAPGTSPDDAQAAVQKLRKLASTFAGQRIILNDLDVAETANDAQTKRLTTNRTSRTANASTMQLQIDNRADRLSTLDAASLRPLLDRKSTRLNS